MDVVSDLEERVFCWVTGRDGVGEFVLCILDLVRGRVEVVAGVEVEVGDDVSEFLQIGFAAACCGAGRVGRTHVPMNY